MNKHASKLEVEAIDKRLDELGNEARQHAQRAGMQHEKVHVCDENLVEDCAARRIWTG